MRAIMSLSKALHELAVFWAEQPAVWSAQELAWRECRLYCARIRVQLTGQNERKVVYEAAQSKD